MTFIQLVEGHTDRYDEMRALDQEWEEGTEGRRTARRAIMTRDRDNPRHFIVVAFFDSYESAMENSNMPETQAFAEKMMALVDGPPTFHNLDVIDDNS